MDVETAIEIRVEQIGQLFDTLDPFPFRERDLDKHAEEYIVGWAREFPRNRSIKIIVHAPKDELRSEQAHQLGEAFARYFNYRAEVVDRDLNELFRVGRQSLLIGVIVLAACVLAARAVTIELGSETIGGILRESLIILGWVANWKPIEIFLYDWWPLARRRNLYRRLAAATVELRPIDTGSRLPGALEMTRSTSDVAVCCSSASARCFCASANSRVRWSSCFCRSAVIAALPAARA